jgi:ABC-type lipoprotein release transport system permease subunit
VLLGAGLADRLGLGVGARVALEAQSIRLFTVAGVAAGDAGIWSADAIVCGLDEAAIVFGEAEHYTDVCLFTRPGYATLVGEAVERMDPRYRVQTRAIVEGYVRRGMTMRGGVFTILAALALALAIPAYLVMTYLGAAPRRREIGLLKTEGWRTAEVLEMVLWENALVSVAAAAVSMLLAIGLVRGLDAPLVASFFIPETAVTPDVEVPARFLPLPAVLAVLFSLVVTMTGSIAGTWRAATIPAAEAMR